MPFARILIVDDDPLSREFLTAAVGALGFETLDVASGREALDALVQKPADLVLTDLRMPGMDGLQLVEELGKSFPGLPAVVVTAHGTLETAIEAMRRGAADFLLKPCTPDSIELVLRRVERTHRLVQENLYLRSEIVGETPPEMIAKAPAMMDLLRSASKIARSKGTVLITGESGTGKERIAHYIHKTSPRHDGPFVRVNCAALSEQLLESELFGHERGAFTGAHKTRPGRFELADSGTLLLDEIGEISPALQSKLLRVLEEEEFERVGGSTTLAVDVRVLATTNRDLPAEIAAGRFREDLYYRLHVLPLHLPSLRGRPEDIVPLAQHFAETYARTHGRPTPRFTNAAIERLKSWSWPGNVRELENLVQRAVVLLKGNAIDVNDLAFGPSHALGTPAPNAAMPGAGLAPSRNCGSESEEELGVSLANRRVADIERVAILATLSATGGNKTEAARRLGLTARTLSNKMKLWREAGLVA